LSTRNFKTTAQKRENSRADARHIAVVVNQLRAGLHFLPRNEWPIIAGLSRQSGGSDPI